MLLGVLFTACSEEEAQQDNNVPQGQVESFEEMVVPEDFAWSTQSDFTVNIEGLSSLPFEVQRVLYIKDADGKVVAKRLVKMSSNSSFTFSAAAINETFVFEYGSLTTEVAAQGNTLNFSFVPADDTSDLEPGTL